MDLTNIALRSTAQPVQGAREVRGSAPVSGAVPAAGEKEQGAAPLYDTYVPEDRSVKQSAGLYRLSHDENGTPKIEFDRPETAEETTTSTDAVDQEIQALKKKREQLEQQLNAAEDPAQARKLEQQLAQTESELQQKDNDAYRRQNAVIS